MIKYTVNDVRDALKLASDGISTCREKLALIIKDSQTQIMCDYADNARAAWIAAGKKGKQSPDVACLKAQLAQMKTDKAVKGYTLTLADMPGTLDGKVYVFSIKSTDVKGRGAGKGKEKKDDKGTRGTIEPTVTNLLALCEVICKPMSKADRKAVINAVRDKINSLPVLQG